MYFITMVSILQSYYLEREGRSLCLSCLLSSVYSNDDILIKNQGRNYVIKKVTIRTSIKSDGKSRTSCRSCWTKTVEIKGN